MADKDGYMYTKDDPNDKYGYDVTGVYEKRSGKTVSPTIDTKPKPITIKHAQKLAMKYGDTGTYFQRKTANKKKAAKR